MGHARDHDPPARRHPRAATPVRPRTGGESLDRIVKDLAAPVLTEHGLKIRFRARAARGDRVGASALLDRFDEAEAGQGASQ